MTIVLVRMYAYDGGTPRQMLAYLPIPIAYAIWYITRVSSEPVTHLLSLPLTLVSLVFFMITCAPLSLPVRSLCALIAVAASLLIRTSPLMALWAVKRDPRAALIAVLMGFSYRAYLTLNEWFWYPLCKATAELLQSVLKIFNSDVYIADAYGQSIELASKYYAISVFKPCSGMEGMTLFTFVACALFLKGWNRYRHCDLSTLLFGLWAYIFLFNCLRIMIIFVLGHAAHHPSAPTIVQEFNWLPVWLFHSVGGTLLYLLAFAIIFPVMEKIADRAALKERIQTDET